MTNTLYIDFEYNRTSAKHLNLICVAFKYFEDDEEMYQGCYWLWDNAEAQACREVLWPLLKNSTIVSFALQAEARSLYSLFHPYCTYKDIKGIDLQLNYKMLVNRNNELAYGKQLIGGKEVVTEPPLNKYERPADYSEKDHAKPETSLAACTYKMLGIKIDTDRKTYIRDLIIASEPKAIRAHKKEIMDYCLSDVEYLPQLLTAQFKYMRRKSFPVKEIKRIWGNVAEYACRSATMEALGYPVKTDELKCFVSNLPNILNSAAEKVNEDYPDVKAFQWSEKAKLYTQKLKPIREWIKANHPDDWRKTDKGDIRVSIDAFQDHYRSTSPGFGGAMAKYLSTKRSLNGFSPRKGKSSFFDQLGPDGRSRPYFGTYGSQTSRSQPSATYYLPLKARWMRYLIQPRRGRALTSIDYSSQEFLIAALLAGDEKMARDYATGDPYLAFGRSARLVPKEATKHSHGRERETFKTLVLGVQFDMSPAGLSRRLSLSSEKSWTVGEAHKLIETFYNVYWVLAEWKEQVLSTYREERMLQLSDGWIMFGDNDNWRSIGNFRIQGEGAVLMRRAVANAQDAGLDVLYTLHDALTIEHDLEDYESIRTLGKAMHQAFLDVFKGARWADSIRIEGNTWGHGYQGVQTPNEDFFGFPVDFTERYVDSRGSDDLQRYKQFLTVQNN